MGYNYIVRLTYVIYFVQFCTFIIIPNVSSNGQTERSVTLFSAPVSLVMSPGVQQI